MVRQLFLKKTFKLLKNNVIHCKHLCAFALAASVDSQKDESLNYMAEIIRNRHRQAKVSQTSAVKRDATDDPVCSVMFLIHILAHDTEFPSQDSEYEEKASTSFFSPLFFSLQALLNPCFVDGDMNRISTVVPKLHNIFNAIKRAEDALDVHKTSRLHVLANLGAKYLVDTKMSGPLVSHTTTNVLLPSLLYRKSDAQQRKQKKVISSSKSMDSNDRPWIVS